MDENLIAVAKFLSYVSDTAAIQSLYQDSDKWLVIDERDIL